MKTTIKLFSIVLSIICIASCKKSNQQSSLGTFTWTYKSVKYNANFILASENRVAGKPQLIASTSSLVSNNNIKVSVDAFYNTTFSFGVPFTTQKFDFVTPDGSAESAKSGTLVMKKIDNILEGFFYVTLTNNELITGDFCCISVSP